jgi:ATP-dependent exoDNAse (exonuclease V) beta subunit
VLAQGATSIRELEARVTEMFQETTGGKLDVIVCSSVHKAKGLERNRVFGLVETLYPGGRKDKIEEQNIEYVMLTRAKQTFVAVNARGPHAEVGSPERAQVPRLRRRDYPGSRPMTLDLLKQVVDEEIRQRRSRISRTRAALKKDLDELVGMSVDFTGYTQGILDKALRLRSAENELEVLLEQKKNLTEVE